MSGLLQGAVIYKDAMILAVHRGAIDFLMLSMQEFDVIVYLTNHTKPHELWACIYMYVICSISVYICNIHHYITYTVICK